MDSYHELPQPSFNIYFVILEEDTNVHYTYMAIYFGHKYKKHLLCGLFLINLVFQILYYSREFKCLRCFILPVISLQMNNGNLQIHL